VVGDEWDYVILSTVRSLPEYEIDRQPSEGWCYANMGFICDPHQINVALTRARMGLIIVGNYKRTDCFASGRGTKHCDQRDVCLSVCRLTVCPLAYIEKTHI